MKRNFLAGLLILVGFIFCNLQNALAKVTGEFEIRSKYVSKMVGSTIVSAPVVQSWVGANLGNNLTANAWLSLHADEPWKIRKGDELDLFLCHNSSFGNVSNTLLLFYYDLYPILTLKGDLFAVRDLVTFPIGADWNAVFTFEWEIPEDSKVLEGGLFYKAELSHEMLQVGKSKVIGTLTLGGHDGAYGLEPEPISFVSGKVSSVFDQITPAIIFQWGGKKDGLVKNEVIFDVNVKFCK